MNLVTLDFFCPSTAKSDPCERISARIPLSLRPLSTVKARSLTSIISGSFSSSSSPLSAAGGAPSVPVSVGFVSEAGAGAEEEEGPAPAPAPAPLAAVVLG